VANPNERGFESVSGCDALAAGPNAYSTPQTGCLAEYALARMRYGGVRRQRVRWIALWRFATRTAKGAGDDN
jgi:hypothetical protein